LRCDAFSFAYAYRKLCADPEIVFEATRKHKDEVCGRERKYVTEEDDVAIKNTER
jgi:hypothetical protein